MWDALQKEWGKIEQEYIDKLYQSMQERVAVVKEANCYALWGVQPIGKSSCTEDEMLTNQ